MTRQHPLHIQRIVRVSKEAKKELTKSTSGRG
jgi:hypothetical protein